MDQTMTEEDMDTEDNRTPLDDIVSRIDGYIKNPKLVTTETLEQLKADIIDLKGVVDEEDDEPEEGTPMKGGGRPSIVIAIGHAMKKRGKDFK